MKISGAVIFEKDKDTGEMKQFLEIYFNGNTRRIGFSDFRDKFSDESTEDFSDPQVVSGVTAVGQYNPQLPTGALRFKKALDFLLEGVVEAEENLTTDTKLIVESDSFLFLRLPWEIRVDQRSTVVFRQVPDGLPNEKQEEAFQKRARFLIIRSHSFKVGSRDIGDLRERMTAEVRGIVDNLTEWSDKKLHVGPIQIIKHTTREELSRIDFGSVHYVHMVMHGEENGSLCLEQNGSSDQIEVISRDEFLDVLDRAGVNGVLLFFLSFCYSGGGGVHDTSLTFELVKRGIAEFAIGYDGGAGDKFALDFAKYFYPLLANGKSIKESFSEACKQRLSPQYFPVLYGRFFEEGGVSEKT